MSGRDAVVKGPYNQGSVRVRIEAFFLDNIGKVATRSLAGKPLTKFRTTRYRRIPVIYGIVLNGIRHDNHHTVEIRRPKIDDLENVGFPARFLGSKLSRWLRIP